MPVAANFFFVNRDAIQTKSYAQKMIKKLKQGTNIYQELDDAKTLGIAPIMPSIKCTRIGELPASQYSTASERSDTGTSLEVTFFKQEEPGALETVSAAIILCQLRRGERRKENV